jgi:hypothetical protein
VLLTFPSMSYSVAALSASRSSITPSAKPLSFRFCMARRAEHNLSREWASIRLVVAEGWLSD